MLKFLKLCLKGKLTLQVKNKILKKFYLYLNLCDYITSWRSLQQNFKITDKLVLTPNIINPLFILFIRVTCR